MSQTLRGQITMNTIVKRCALLLLAVLLQASTYASKLVVSKPQNHTINFTKEELSYLKNKPFISAYTDPDWQPYSYITSDGEFKGILYDVLALISKKINKEIRILPTEFWYQCIENMKLHKGDILVAIIKTRKRDVYLDYTDVFFQTANVIATKKDNFFIEGAEDVAGRVFAIKKGYAMVTILTDRYPSIEFIQVESGDEGLLLVEDDKAFGYIDSLQTVNYLIQKHKTSDIKISNALEGYYDLHLGVHKNNSILQSILNKGIRSITKTERNFIIESYQYSDYDSGIDYSSLLKYLLIIIIVIVIFYCRYSTIKVHNRQLAQSRDEINTLYKNAEKSKELLQQSLDSEKKSQQDNLNFIDVIAHEYRTPISVISSTVDLFEKELELDNQENKKYSNHFETIRRSKNRIISLFTSSLNENRLKNSKEILKHKSIAAAEVIKNSLDRCKYAYPEAEITSNDNTCKHLLLMGEKELLITALTNVFENACKYSSLDSPVDIIVDQEGDSLIIKIQDRGIGISEKDQEKVFDKFYRSNHVGAVTGVGLGLYLVKQIIVSHNGEIHVESVLGTGTKFTISLPCSFSNEQEV